MPELVISVPEAATVIAYDEDDIEVDDITPFYVGQYIKITGSDEWMGVILVEEGASVLRLERSMLGTNSETIEPSQTIDTYIMDGQPGVGGGGDEQVVLSTGAIINRRLR